ncbi:MAG: BON domain-containing protein [Betaproteobacteria bacterium]
MKIIRPLSFPLLPIFLLLAVALQGCVEMAVMGAGAAAISAYDRRTTGAQVDDEAIELRSGNRVSERFGDKVHVNITSYNRSVLLTGEVPNGSAKAEIEKIVAATTNVRSITNDLQVAGGSSLSSRAGDAGITGKVKARFLDANRFNTLQVKVVTEASVVYLMGIVTEAEAAAAVEVARTTGGVRKVVKVFEYCKPTDAVCAPPKPKAEEPKKSGS